MLDANAIMNGLTLAGVIWIAASVSGLRERMTRVETILRINQQGEHHV